MARKNSNGHSSANGSASFAGDEPLVIPAHIPRCERRNVASWMPVQKRFSTACKVLGLDQQVENTKLQDQFVRRKARRVAKVLRAQAAAMAG